MKNNLKRIASLALAVTVLLCSLLFSSCGAPKLEDVKDDFTRLIKESYGINAILFGDGLSGYGNLDYDEESDTYYTFYYTKKDGRLCAYRDSELGRYVVLKVSDTDGEGCVYKNEDRGEYFYPSDIEYTDADHTLPDTPYGYRHVRADERCTTINEIASLASTVYSEDYLADLFTFLFDNSSSESLDKVFSAKYIEMVDEESGKSYLLCADANTCPPVDDGKRVYDYDSMVIAKRSRSNYVNVEIKAYGRYADLENGTITTGWHTVSLSFVRENGEWRLDSPTY